MGCDRAPQGKLPREIGAKEQKVESPACNTGPFRVYPNGIRCAEHTLSESSALADFAFFVRVMRPAHRAILLDLELFGHRPFVLRRGVIGAAAVSARHFDEITHNDSNASLCRVGMNQGKY